MPLKRAVAEFGKTYKDRFALRTYPGTSVPIFIFILGWSRTKPRVTLSAHTMSGEKGMRAGLACKPCEHTTTNQVVTVTAFFRHKRTLPQKKPCHTKERDS